MRKYLRNILFVLALFCTQLFMAQKLYWVGSSGNFNDAAHWSYTSGGVGGTKTPTATSDVYFDENSFSGQSLINFIGSTQVHDLIFSEYTPKVIFSGLQNEKITIHGNLSLNAYIENHFVGEIWLTSNQVNTSVSFALTKLKGNIYFNGNTTWLIPTNILADDNSTVYFKQGIFNLNNTSINSGNLIASAGVTINSNQTTFRITNKFVLPNGVVFNDTKSTIRAYTKDPAKFQVAPTITFNTNSRLNNLNNVMTACNITGSSTQPTCSGNCDGTITFNIPAAECSGSDTIFLHWANSINCTTQLRDTFFTSGSPSTYSVGDICACLDQYPSIFSNNIAEDTVYASPLGVSMANPRPPQIQNPFTPFPPSCFGKCDGKIVMNIAIGSGVAPLTSTWTLPSGGTVVHTPLGNTTTNHHDTLKLACAGIYTVSLTDVHGCTSAISTTVLAQPTKVVSTPTFTNPLCSGSCTGIIQDNPSGGIPPYICTMDSAGGAGPNLAMPGCSVSGLCAGTYTVFAKDAHGCKDTNFVTIVPPPAITFLTSGTSTISCLNACNGSVSVTNVLGGTPFTVGNAYTYSWSPPGVGTMTNTTNSSTYSGLCGSVAGITYTCTIKDSNNCVKTTTFMIKAPPALTLTPTHTNPKCNLSIDGSATVTASGGAPAYTFTWAPQSGTTGGVSPKSIYSGIGGGTYTAYVTDANGCLDSTTVTLIPPPAITGTMTTVTPPTCPNLNNGHMCVTAGGGTPGPGYTYTWSPNPPAIGTASCTPNTLTVTPGGTSVYNVTITDANSCTLTVSGTFTSPPLVAVTATITSPPCSGSSNGSATLTPISGVPTFSYLWSCSVVTTNTISGQPGGSTCNYTVTDGNSCRTTGAVNFTLPTPLTLSLISTTLSCAGDCNATITSNAAGGNPFPGPPSYTYSWTGTGVNAVSVNAVNQVGMCAGNYTCNITDANGCPQTATTSITAPTPISITLTPTNPTCSGLCTGIINAVIGGGTGALTHTWVPAPPNPPNPANTLNPNSLCAGITYSLEVTDSKGCVDSDTLTLISPPAVTFVLATTSITCAGGTGAATVTISGGVPNYSYNWDNSGFTPLAGPITSTTNLSAGTHTIVVEDSKGCLSTPDIFPINPPALLVASIANIIGTCNGLANGSATATATGGTPPYSYNWDNIPAGTYLASDSIKIALSIGTHTLYVKDANGCTAFAVFNVPPVVSIAISVSSATVSCYNFCDATATATASGGFPPYTIQWVGTTTCTAVTSSCTASGLCSGTQTVIATDNHGCFSTSTITIVNPTALSASTNTTSVQCFGQCTGAATVTPSGGTQNAIAPFYTINWIPASLPTGTVVTTLCPGTYTANILDHNGCVFTQTVAIGVSGQFSVIPTLTNPSTCGAGDGSISITVSGGSGTYTVNWALGGTPINSSPVFTYSNIPAGSYTATINDANGCDTTIVYGLSSPIGPVMSFTATNATCFGVCDGSATVVATGTNTPIQVAWQSSPFQIGTSSVTATALCGGNPLADSYLVKATDAIGCITFTTVTITSHTKIGDSATVTEPTCGGSNGIISLIPSGGSGPVYMYSWSGGGTNNPHGALPAGVDTVKITDGSGLCSQVYIYTLTTSPTLNLSVSTTSTTCSYLNNGTATAAPLGGTPAYSYTWTGSSGVIPPSGKNITNISNLPCGNYTLNVKDSTNCAIQTTFSIACPVPINPHLSKTNDSCSIGNTGTASVTPTGGNSSGYSYFWSVPTNPTTQSVNSLFSGIYSVIITDANTCTVTVPFTITAPSPLSMTVTSTPPTCFGGTNGTATVTVSGGTPFSVPPPYTYTWSNSNNTPTTSNLNVGIYIITVADSNLCSLSQVLNFSVQPTQITPSITVTNISCGGNNCNGSIVSTPTGGIGAFTFSWTPLGGVISCTACASSTYSGLCANTYTLVIMDSNSCTVTTPAITLNPPSLPQLTYTTTSATCGTIPCNGSITITSTIGNAPIGIHWINTACGSSVTCNTLCVGTYSVQLTDAANCIDTIPLVLSNSNGPVVVSSYTNVTCYGSSNGAAFETVISGSPPYTFSWTPSVTVTTTTVSSLDAGLIAGVNYFSTVTDGAGCITITTFSIGQPTQIQDNPTIHSASCFGINNGSIISSGSGGTPFSTGYEYSIDGGPFSSSPSTSFTFTPLSAGSHIVCIKDSLHCINCFTYSITSIASIVSTISATKATCFGNCNGTATVSNINGGTPNYVVTWNDLNNQVGLVATTLCAGSYTATITDNFGCQAKDTITIVAPSAINPHPVITNPTCNSCNGIIALSPSGGTGTTYTFTWSNSANTSSSQSNLCAGLCPVEITDSLGCEQNFSIPISNSNSPTVAVTAINATCNGLCNGTATVSVTSGGIAPFTYLWPNITPVPTTSVVSSLCSNNTYFVEVKDSVGCIATQSVTIAPSLSFTVNTTKISPSCTVCNGVITTTVVGSSSYSYQWSANALSATTSSVTVLCADIYTLVVTDNTSGCSQTALIILNNNSGPSLSITATEATCNGLCNGSATVTITGGTPIITQIWNTNPPQATINANNLCGDSTYVVQVTDGVGCIQTKQVIIHQPSKLSSGLSIISPIKCHNDSGNISTDIFGGSLSYTYSWTPSTVTGAGGTNLSAGNYSVLVTDKNGCTINVFDTLKNPPLLTITGTVTPATCNNVPDGAIFTTIFGGTPGISPLYTWQWSGGSNATTQNLPAILHGNYSVTVTDSRGCVADTHFIVIATVTVTTNAGRDTILCSSLPFILTGTVTGTATFDWQTITGTLIPPANTLTLSVNPATPTQYVLYAVNGLCTSSDTIKVSVASLPLANAGPNQSVFIGQTATIGGNPTNSVGTTIVWEPNSSLSDSTVGNPIASPAITTTYTVIVTNSLGCKATDTMMVIVLPPFTITTGFTPNNDGKNDTWMIDNLYMFPNVEVEVYNRWGEQLFYAPKGTYTPWNGTYKGQPVPVGTYYYIVRLNDPKYPDHYAGPLTILR